MTDIFSRITEVERLQQSLENVKSKFPNDRIEGDTILLDEKGQFPKKLIIILESGKRREYRIVKTRNGGYILN